MAFEWLRESVADQPGEPQKGRSGAYPDAFRKTPLLMLIGGGECLTDATDMALAGERIASVIWAGSPGRGATCDEGSPTRIEEAGIQDTWKATAVAWETCWEMRKWVNEGWSLRYIFNYALACHASYINNKSAPLPPGPEVRPELERFLRRLGYRLVLKELKHAANVKTGDKLEIAMKWQNTGSAPCYKPYRLAYRLSNESGYSKVIMGNVTVNRWLPGSIDLFTDEFFRTSRICRLGKS